MLLRTIFHPFYDRAHRPQALLAGGYLDGNNDCIIVYTHGLASNGPRDVGTMSIVIVVL